jgi:hypothetical protein
MGLQFGVHGVVKLEICMVEAFSGNKIQKAGAWMKESREFCATGWFPEMGGTYL